MMAISEQKLEQRPWPKGRGTEWRNPGMVGDYRAFAKAPVEDMEFFP